MRDRQTSDARATRTLSTGHEVALPLEVAFAVGGVVVPARRRRLAGAIPDALSPLPIGPGLGCAALVGVGYRRVGGGSGTEAATGLEPYDEFAVIVPVVRGNRTGSPLRGLLEGEFGGYVHWLPVTTDASVALGREIWGYPKERADVTVTDGPRSVRTVVGPRADEAARLEVRRPLVRLRGQRRDWTVRSYTEKDGDLLCSRIRIRGDVVLGSPLGARLEIGPRLRRELGLRERPLARVYGGRVSAWLSEGEPIDDPEP